MDVISTDTLDFLQLNTLLQQCLTFATDNAYQQRPLSPSRLATFGTQMQQLFVFNERWQLMPDQTGLPQAEQVCAVYPDTQNALIDLIYSCPQPADAEHWFDYQQEYQARTQQLNNLKTLFDWHQQLYQQLLQRFPQIHLTVANPTIDPKADSIVQQTAGASAAPESTGEGKAPGDSGLPALQL